MQYRLLGESGIVLESVFRQKVRLLRTHCTIIVYITQSVQSIASISDLGDIFSSAQKCCLGSYTYIRYGPPYRTKYITCVYNNVCTVCMCIYFYCNLYIIVLCSNLHCIF